MDTAVWIVIVVAVLLLIAALVMLPRMRAKSRERQAQRELGRRRERVATESREEAGERSRQAEQAEQKAAAAQQAAERERAEAHRLENEADRHERGVADDELIEDHERDRFGPVSGTPVDSDADGRDDRVAQDERSGRFDREDERTGDRPAARRSDA